MKKFLIGLAVVAVIVVGFIWTTYNRLVTGNEAVTNAWQQVEVQYQRRFDLIPNLVASVQGAMKQEQAVFNALAEARSKYAGAATPDEKARAATQVEGSLSRLLVVMENYPDLRSTETVQTLMTQLEGTENRISVERSRYNDGVQSFNAMIKRFPTSIVARLAGFEARTYFEAASGADQAPSVSF